MSFLFLYSALLLFTIFSTFGDAASTRITTTFSTQFCVTQSGTRKISPVPRTTSATTYQSHISLTSTTTPSTTITPARSTITSTSTSTVYTTSTLPTVTQSFTTTITSTTTKTATATSTQIDTETTTTTTTVNIATTTIAEAADFTAVENDPSVSGLGSSNMERRDIMGRNSNNGDMKRGTLKVPVPPAFKGIGNVDKPAPNCPTYYPTKIECTRTVTYVTMTITTATAKRTTFTAMAPSTTTTVTTTSTSTIFSTPADVSTTSTEYTTLTTVATTTQTTTMTSTTTTTTTSYTAASTIYAVCEDSANYLAQVNNTYVRNWGTYGVIYYLSTDNPYDCCVICAQSNDCAFSTFNPSEGLCVYSGLYQNDCDASYYIGYFWTNSSSSNYVMSNSNCGRTYYNPDASG